MHLSGQTSPSSQGLSASWDSWPVSQSQSSSSREFDMANCTACGSSLKAGIQFCTKCGTRVSAPVPTSDQRSTTSRQPSPQQTPVASSGSPSPSIQASLGRLGIQLSSRHLVGFILASLAGMVVARILPFIYPYVFFPLLAIVFQGNPSGSSDSFNSFMMTAITFLTSFVISFITFRKPPGA